MHVQVFITGADS